MHRDSWMSSFYGCPWTVLSDIAEVDAVTEGLVECRIDATEYRQIDLAQQRGFVLVESTIEFVTAIRSVGPVAPGVRPGTAADLEGVLTLVKPCFLEHPRFYSRFKHRGFFTEAQCRTYYESAVRNFFAQPGTVSVVATDAEGVAAFRIMKTVDEGTYRGVIGAVHPRASGRRYLAAMQRASLAMIGRPYTEENRTQLGNTPVIRSHLAEGRQWTRIEHIFLKRLVSLGRTSGHDLADEGLG